MNERDYARAADAFGEGRHMDALTVLNRLLSDNTSPLPAALLGETLQALGLRAEAAEAFETAARLGHVDGVAFLRRAMLLHFDCGNDDRAQLLGLKLFSVVPEDVDVAYVLATLFHKAGEMALVDLVKNALVESDDPRHLALALELIGDEEHNPAVLKLFRKLVALEPDNPFKRFKYMNVARCFADFDAIEAEEAVLYTELARGNRAVFAAETGYANLLHCTDESLNRLATNIRVRPQPISALSTKARRMRPHRWGERLRIGYLSNDFWDDHATMRLLQSVIEAHDRTRFEITLYCHTPDRFLTTDGSNRAKWGRIVSIAALTDDEAARTIRADDIDILVDLKGHTSGSRASILNRMAAPVQVAWLGFPGSTAGIDCDYVIGDPIVLPDSSKPHYHERFCRLPETYQPNDPIYRVLPQAAQRSALGLPEHGFIYAAFNTTRKISLETMTLWMRILQQSPDAVLWVMIDNDIARRNFLKRADRHGIDATRIVFAEKTAYDRHIARVQAADLGLDTFPYNGHTTTSDVLWAGVPVLTKTGSNFASRVSESLLKALDLPELVATTDAGFVDLAVALSKDRRRLAALKARIADNRFVAPLFDAERFCRHLESAYAMMGERARTGAMPDHMDVPALPRRLRPFR